MPAGDLPIVKSITADAAIPSRCVVLASRAIDIDPNVRPYPVRRQDAARQAACTNCICVPASSMTSPFFKLTVSPTRGELFTVGRAEPSTWAST